MAIELTMPQMGYDMQEGTVVRWLKAEGDAVGKGEPIAEIETDKAVVEFQSYADGLLQRIIVPEGETVPVGAPIAMVGEGADDVAPPTPVSAAPEAPAEEAPPAVEAPAPPAAAVPLPPPPPPARPEIDHVRASPVARRIAEERGIDLAQLVGTGPGGRITREDVEQAEAPGDGWDGDDWSATDGAMADGVAPVAGEPPQDGAAAQEEPPSPADWEAAAGDEPSAEDAAAAEPSPADWEAAAGDEPSAEDAAEEPSPADWGAAAGDEPSAEDAAEEPSPSEWEVAAGGEPSAEDAAEEPAPSGWGAAAGGEPSAEDAAEEPSAGAEDAAPAPEPELAEAEEAAAYVAGAEPLSRMRRQVARVTVGSKTEIPHFYVSTEIDMTSAMEMRGQINSSPAFEGARVSVNDLILRACVEALRRYPKFNASFSSGGIRMNERINIGMAVAGDESLIVPAINDAQDMSLRDIAVASRDLAERAKGGTITADEYTSGTFTVSNLGMFDVSAFVAIIHPPQAAVLAVGSVARRPVVRGDRVEVADVMTATVSADHRVVDGAEGALFVGEIKSILENPYRLLV